MSIPSPDVVYPAAVRLALGTSPDPAGDLDACRAYLAARYPGRVPLLYAKTRADGSVPVDADRVVAWVVTDRAAAHSKNVWTPADLVRWGRGK